VVNRRQTRQAPNGHWLEQRPEVVLAGGLTRR